MLGKTKRQLVSVPQEGGVLWKSYQLDRQPLESRPDLQSSNWTRSIQVPIRHLTHNRGKANPL